MQKEYDKLFMKFEITHDYVDGGIERTCLEKDREVITGIETHLEVVIDTFVDFLRTYGFQPSTVLEAFEDFVDYSKEGE